MTTVRRAMALLALVLVALVVTTGILLPAPAAASQHASGRFSPDVAAGGSPAASSPWSVAVVYVQAGTATSGCSVQRYYDPGTGQFMSVDPLNGMTDAGYSFVEDNPLDGSDPTGTAPHPTCGISCDPNGGSSASSSSSAVSQSTASASTTSPESVNAANGCNMNTEAPPATSNQHACSDANQVMTGPGGFTSDPVFPGWWAVLFTLADELAIIGGDPSVPDDDPTVPDPVDDPAAEGGTDSIRAAGQAGEQAAGIIKNTQRIPSLTGTASYRIPDELNASVLGEVKNVSSLSYTSQLQDFELYAQQQGLTFNLYVRGSTTLSGPLQAEVNAGNINLIRSLPG
jgi:hypothetical protein